MREERTDVLVVGAGPVGLCSALLLAKAGLEVSIIDREPRTAARSYACALHPRSLELLDRLGLAASLLDRGHKVQTVAFYQGDTRRAEIKLSALPTKFPFLLILPQDVLEGALEEQLRQAGVSVHWNHRFDAFHAEPEAVVATVEELGGTATGYIVPHWEAVVKHRSTVQASFLLGADGANSLVRHRAGIENEQVAGPFFFAAYEFEAEAPPADEVRVVLDDTTTNVLWPLLGNRCRWTFQLVQSELSREFPEKERRAIHVAQKIVDERIRDYVQRVARNRAPWFTAGVKEVTWCTEVVFEHRLARQFGRDRCWLTGDAAHQAGPVGVQSMNAGLQEAEGLVSCLRQILREHAAPTLLQAYERDHQAQWRRLLGLNGGLQARNETNSWVKTQCSRLLPCLPATGPELVTLARQLQLEVG
jgi:2-polyprenyl-6-methoxyphenol hydroxylase-like FAD-dependent oxidoreductase